MQCGSAYMATRRHTINAWSGIGLSIGSQKALGGELGVRYSTVP